jgi:hypothetical protein
MLDSQLSGCDRSLLMTSQRLARRLCTPILTGAALVLGGLGCAEAPASSVPPPIANDADPSALTAFRTALDGHGTWVDDAQNGTVWVPSRAEVGDHFVPYASGGHWGRASDTDEVVWFSVYEWGWGPFHYGRWVLGNVGWAWVPGRSYSAAWVDWRRDQGVVTWAPTPPSFIWHHGVAQPTGRTRVRVAAMSYMPPDHVFTETPSDAAGLALAHKFARPAAPMIAPAQVQEARLSDGIATGASGRRASGPRRSSHEREAHHGSEHVSHGRR